ncbi:ABC transporter permease [Streptomyces sp. ODS28]|uniref:ABC transporter permease n=1 Tax=Streptomyces sp. ODS28 TaxID=3136688 RepID=UPI0031EFDE3B
MASTETTPADGTPAPGSEDSSGNGEAAADGTAVTGSTSAQDSKAGKDSKAAQDTKNGNGLADLGAGLDVLDTHAAPRRTLGEVLRGKVLPPVIAVVLVLALWQLAYALELKPHSALPSPADVAGSLRQKWLEGTLLGYVWNSISRGALGFAVALVAGTVLGLTVARVRPVRAAIGPILSGLQSLPSVAWVPAAIIWFGLTDATIYAVVLLGAVPSIANGIVAGVDQIQPMHLRAGKVIGATGLRGVWHVLLPAALPGYIAGLKQGWAFSWRSLMAAELIAQSPDLGTGLGQLLDQARMQQDMSLVLSAILLILLVGIGIELLIFAPVERRVLRNRGLLASGH